MTDIPNDKKLSERFGEAINDGYEAVGDLVAEYGDAILSVLCLAEAQPSAGTFKLGDELLAYRAAAEYDATMEGPRFKGWNRSQLERARLITFGMLIDEKDPAK